MLGSALSQAIPTDNVFEQVAVTSVLSAIGQNLGQAINAGLTTDLRMTDIAELTLADFGGDVAAGVLVRRVPHPAAMSCVG